MSKFRKKCLMVQKYFINTIIIWGCQIWMYKPRDQKLWQKQLYSIKDDATNLCSGQDSVYFKENCRATKTSSFTTLEIVHTVYWSHKIIVVTFKRWKSTLSPVWPNFLKTVLISVLKYRYRVIKYSRSSIS